MKQNCLKQLQSTVLSIIRDIKFRYYFMKGTIPTTMVPVYCCPKTMNSSDTVDMLHHDLPYLEF